MPLLKMTHCSFLMALTLLAAPAAARAGAPPSGAPVVGAVYTMTNAPDGNAVLVYDRLPNGRVRFRESVPTEGLGTGGGLGNQGGVTLSRDGRWLLVVNAGSDELSLFEVSHAGLALRDTVASGGVRPVSVAVDRRLVYVVHAGDDAVAGFRLDDAGELVFLEGSRLPLSDTETGPAQVAFSPGGEFLLVTEKATSRISTYRIDSEGLPEGPMVQDSAGTTPFAMDFAARDLLLVSEVFGGGEAAGAVSSYRLEADGSLTVLAPSVANHQTAPCWLVATTSGRVAYTTNTPDDSLSAYAVERDGSLELLDEDGSAAEPGEGTRPLDMDLSRDGRFLYTLNIGNDRFGVFRTHPDGSLTHLGDFETVADGANGLAAW